MARILNIGAHLDVEFNPNPAASGAGTTDGGAFDRYGLGGDARMSCVMAARAGAASGTPSAQSLTYTLQHSHTTTGGDFVNLTDPDGVTPTIVLDADNEAGEVDVNLVGARRYIRIKRVAAFTGGSTPTWANGSCLVMGGSLKAPV